MNDDNWEMIAGEKAYEIEVLNYANQVNVIEALVYLLMYHHGAPGPGCERPPSVNVLKEFHRTATLFLLNNPGECRDVPVVVKKNDVVVHTPPPHEEVNDHLTTFFETLSQIWQTATAPEIAAYCLWMINWVHPFRNGNGRTARAFCYACICLKLGFSIPGRKTVIDMIMDDRDTYYAELAVADEGYRVSGAPHLAGMVAFIDRLLFTQLTAAVGE